MIPTLPIVSQYAAIMALLFIALSAYVVAGRWKFRTAFGTGGNEEMERRVRAHGNFSEYVPFTLLLLAVAELRAAPTDWVQGLCIALLVGRLLHIAGVYRPVPNLLRAGGMMLTFASMIGASLLILIG